MKDIIVLDQETGVTFTYKWRDSYGWCVSFCDKAYTDENIEFFRKLMAKSREYWPEVPEHLQEEVDKNNQEMVDVCRGLVIEDWE